MLVNVYKCWELLRNEKETNLIPGVGILLIKNMTQIIIASLIYLLGVIEIGFQVGERLDYPALTTLSVMSYTYLFVLGLWMYAKKIKHDILDKGIALIATVLFDSSSMAANSIR